MIASFVVVLPFYTVLFRGSSLPGYCQKVTIILQAISLKLIQTRKHNIAIPNSECFLPSKPLAYKLGVTNLFFKLEKYVCKTQRMPRVDPTFHFIRLPKVSLGPALNSFEYLSKFQLHNKSLVFKGCNSSK